MMKKHKHGKELPDGGSFSLFMHKWDGTFVTDIYKVATVRMIQ
jgi:hypothetical protein